MGTSTNQPTTDPTEQPAPQPARLVLKVDVEEQIVLDCIRRVRDPEASENDRLASFYFLCGSIAGAAARGDYPEITVEDV